MGRFWEVPGRSRGRFRIKGSGRFRGRFRTTGSGQVPNHVPNQGFREGSGAGSDSRVLGRFWGRFRTTGSGAGSEPRSEPGGRFRFTSSGKFPGQVPNHGFRGRFRGTGFRRDGSRTVLARFLDFRKMAYDL